MIMVDYKSVDMLKAVADSPQGKEILYTIGNDMANQIKAGLEDKSLRVEDEIVVTFLPAILGGGNLEFLKVCATSMYTDTRADVIVDFLDYLLELGEQGYIKMQKKLEGV